MSEEKNGIKGWELLKMISEGKIEDGEVFEVISPSAGIVIGKVEYYNENLIIINERKDILVSGFTFALCYNDRQLASFIFKKIEIVKEVKANLLDVSKAETPFEEEIARKVNEIIEKMDNLTKEE